MEVITTGVLRLRATLRVLIVGLLRLRGKGHSKSKTLTLRTLAPRSAHPCPNGGQQLHAVCGRPTGSGPRAPAARSRPARCGCHACINGSVHIARSSGADAPDAWTSARCRYEIRARPLRCGGREWGAEDECERGMCGQILALELSRPRIVAREGSLRECAGVVQVRCGHHFVCAPVCFSVRVCVISCVRGCICACVRAYACLRVFACMRVCARAGHWVCWLNVCACISGFCACVHV